MRKEASILTNEVINILKIHISKVMQYCQAHDFFVKIGICGYHASIPENVSTFQALGIDYLSCIPKQIHAVKKMIQQSTEEIEQKQSKGNVDRFGNRLNKTSDEIARDKQAKMLIRESIIDDTIR